jgi:hypothetical protein
MIPAAAKSRTCTITHYLIFLFSFFGLCTSEALIPSSTSFLPRYLWTRGGSEGTKQLLSRLTAYGLPNGASEGEISLQTPKSTEPQKKPLNGKSAGNLVDVIVPAEYIAETKLPTDVGQFQLRAYRVKKGSNEHMGTEPCVIYCADKSPFGKNGELNQNVPVRIHDQCLTSEVFRSKR